MEVIVLESGAYYKLLSEMKETLKDAIREGKNNDLSNSFDWISQDEAKKLLGVKSFVTLQKIRDQGHVEFSKFGKIVKYSRKSIEQYIEKISVKKFKK
jgi:hypothetical protein